MYAIDTIRVCSSFFDLHINTVCVFPDNGEAFWNLIVKTNKSHMTSCWALLKCKGQRAKGKRQKASVESLNLHHSVFCEALLQWLRKVYLSPQLTIHPSIMARARARARAGSSPHGCFLFSRHIGKTGFTLISALLQPSLSSFLTSGWDNCHHKNMGTGHCFSQSPIIAFHKQNPDLSTWANSWRCNALSPFTSTKRKDVS